MTGIVTDLAFSSAISVNKISSEVLEQVNVFSSSIPTAVRQSLEESLASESYRVNPAADRSDAVRHSQEKKRTNAVVVDLLLEGLVQKQVAPL